MSESIDFFLSLFYIQYSKTGNFCTFGINNNQTCISQILTVLVTLEEKFNFSILLGFEAKYDLDHKTSRIKSHSVRDLKRYLNNKSPIND